MANIVGMGVDDTNNLVFAWFDNGKVSAGSSKNLSSKRKPAPYKLPQGKTPLDIAEMAIDGTNNTLLRESFLEAFDKIGGTEELTTWAKKNPSEFYRMICHLLPRTVESTGGDGGPIVIRIDSNVGDEGLLSFSEFP
jgi:hypothetical protein